MIKENRGWYTLLSVAAITASAQTRKITEATQQVTKAAQQTEGAAKQVCSADLTLKIRRI